MSVCTCVCVCGWVWVGVGVCVLCPIGARVLHICKTVKIDNDECSLQESPISILYPIVAVVLRFTIEDLISLLLDVMGFYVVNIIPNGFVTECAGSM